MSLTQPLNRYIDHTLLAPQVMNVAFEELLEHAVKHDFRAVCVSPYIAEEVTRLLSPYPSISVCTVVSFPHGNLPLALKVREAAYHIERGIHEIDWVLHFAQLWNENWDRVREEVKAMGDVCKRGNVVSKCIVETAFLPTQEMLHDVFRMVSDYSEVDFIKTSTGYAHDNAKVEQVQYWKELRGNGPRPLIKASGGIKNLKQALSFIEAGADRLGMSASVNIMEEWLKTSVI